MTSSPSLTSNNFIITHHLNTLHNNVGNYFEFICMKTSLTMFDNSDTFENFFLFGCYKLSSVIHQKLFHSWSSTTTSSNFFIHDHQQQLHHPSKTFSFMIINNNFIKLFHSWSSTTTSSSIKNFSFMIINNNFIKLFHSWSSTTTSWSSTTSSNFFIHPCQVHTFSPPDSTTWSTHSS